MWRTVAITSEGQHLCSHQSHLRILAGGEERGRIPLEDLGALILDDCRNTLTARALADCAAAGAVVVCCDARHTPVGMMLPMEANVLLGERARAQADARLPLRKNLWSCILRRKLLNQAETLAFGRARTRLETLAGLLKSGDPDNKEAQGARAYWAGWRRGLPDGMATAFRRDRHGDFPNSLLNYGYMVVRAAVSRALCGAGLIPALGIHHSNRYNAFALADDLMEPYRPWVDAAVLALAGDGCDYLDLEAKRRLLEVLTAPAVVGGGTTPLALAMDQSAATLALCFLRAQRKEATAKELVKGLILPSRPTPDAPATSC